jgi:CBS domain-containing protein
MNKFPLPGIIEFLNKAVPFNTLNADVLQDIVSRTEIAFYPRGEMIIRMGEQPAGYLFVIQTGCARVTVTDESDKEILVDMRGEGDIFGAISLLKGDVALFNVSVEEDLIVFLIPLDVIKSVQNANDAFKRYFDSALARNFKAVRESADHWQSLNTPENRLDIDMFLTGKRVSELMAGDVLTCDLKTTARQAAQKMKRRRVGSVVVTDDTGRPAGIVTDADLRSKILADGLSPQTSVREIMSVPVRTISPDAYTFDALLEMSRLRLSHLAVVENERAVGIISEQDFQIELGSSPVGMIEDIDKSASVNDLIGLRPKTDRILEMALRRSGSVRPMVALFAEINERVAKRFIHLIEKEMADEGHGCPPVPYCWLAMGSEGRQEQTLLTDQDNALLYQDVPDAEDEQVKDWFLRLSRRVVDALDRYGIPRCTGGIMASNPRWCMGAGDWEKMFAGWISDPSPFALRMSTIFFDFRGIAGRLEDAAELRLRLCGRTGGNKYFIRMLAKNALINKPPLGFLRQFAVEKSGENKNELNLKLKGLTPVADAARVLALESGITVTNTMERLEAVADKGLFEPGFLSEVDDAYDFINFIRISHHLRSRSKGDFMNNHIDPARLNNIQRNWLKESFAIVSRLQEKLSIRYQTKL